MSKQDLTFGQAKDRFIMFGSCFCDPRFFETFIPYKCKTQLTICKICKKEHGRIYVN